MKKALLALAAATALCTALPAAAQFAKPEDAIKYRKAVFTMMGAHFSRISNMAQGKTPFDAKAAAENAELVALVSKLPYTAFGPGTDKGETKADPKIWTETDKFNAAANKMQEAVVRLNVAAKSGNLDTIKPAADETAKACKACHDDYRMK